MSLSPRAIAVQGFGYAALFVALQGLVPVTVSVEPQQFAASGGGQLSVADVLRRKKLRDEAAGDTAAQVSELLVDGRVADARELLAAKRKQRRAAEEQQAEAFYILKAKT